MKEPETFEEAFEMGRQDMMGFYVVNIESENTGGGCMVDIITLADGRVLALSDEALALFENRARYDEAMASQRATELWSVWLRTGENA